MKIFHSIADLRAWRQTVGAMAFVPTMGCLHAGHLALIDVARKQAKHVVVSIFVNRLQFSPGEDFARYPHPFEADCQQLMLAGVDALFCPDEDVLYPQGSQAFMVAPPPLENELCGAFRPGHFRAVATIVAKLFNIVQAQAACFGKKDYQQWVIIKGMVHDLNMPIDIIRVDTRRESDGLALSSRNTYLSAAQRAQAPQLFAQLQTISTQRQTGLLDFAALEEKAHVALTRQGWQVDYIAIRQAHTLAIPLPDEKNLVVLAAARLGNTRLIDNIEFIRM